MTIHQLRNRVAGLLSAYLAVPIVLSDQTAEEPPIPFGIYSVLNYRASSPNFGDHRLEESEGKLLDVREEQVKATFSFTFVSQNRREGDTDLYGDDEASGLAERAVGYFNHAGYFALSRAGIVVGNILDVGNRSVLEVDEMSRRYGFDVELWFGRRDVLPLETIENSTIQKE